MKGLAARRLDLLAGAAFAALALAHAGFLFANAVDVPYWDEWDLFAPGGLSRAFDPGWLLARHTESRVIPLKLQYWLGLRLDGLDFRTQWAGYGAAYAAVLALVFALMRSAAPDLPAWVALSFLAFGLSPRVHEAVTYFPPSSHAMIGSLGSALLLLGGQGTWRRPLAGVFLACFGIFAHTDGVTPALVLAAFMALRAADDRRRGSPHGTSAAAAAAIALGAALALAGLGASGRQTPAAEPTSGLFWRFFLNLVSWGFGMDQVSVTLGALCAAVAAIPCARLALQGEHRRSERLALACALAGTLAMLAAMAYGRGGVGPSYAKASRYAARAFVLLPLAAAAWWAVLGPGAARGRAVAALWILGALGHAGNWDFGFYRTIALERRLGLECARAYYRGGSPDCPMGYPGPIGDRLDRARELGVSFAKAGP